MYIEIIWGNYYIIVIKLNYLHVADDLQSKLGSDFKIREYWLNGTFRSYLVQPPAEGIILYKYFLISVIVYDNFLKQVINRCMLDSQKTDINTPSSYLVSSFLFLVFKYDFNQ